MTECEPNIIETNDDIFEINDFTVVTKLEGFIISIESILQNADSWPTESEIANVNTATSILHKKETQQIFFDKIEFQLDYYYDLRRKKIKINNEKNENILMHCNEAGHELIYSELDFNEFSSISLNFGVFHYIVLSPKNSENIITADTNLNTILSAVNVALINSQCNIPFFIQINKKSRELYVGVSQNRNIRIEFNNSQIKEPLYIHKYLNGLVDMFKQQVNLSFPIEQKIYVSIQLNFIYQKESSLPSINDKNEKEDLDQKSDDILVSLNNSKYVVGADLNPIKNLKLSVFWKNIDANILIESEDYIDLDPLNTSKWFVSLTFNQDSMYLLSSKLTNILNWSKKKDFLVLSFRNSNIDLHSAANALKPIASNFGVSQLKFFSTFASDELLSKSECPIYNRAKQCLKTCFDNLNLKSVENLEQSNELTDFIKLIENDYLSKTKSAPINSLASELVSCLYNEFFYCEEREFESFACLWYNFLKYLRDCWENGNFLLGVEKDLHQIDLLKCLFYQKLQMLNFCIKTKQNRHSSLNSKTTEIQNEEFFDANDIFVSLTDLDREPLGRLCVMNPEVYLFNHPDRLIYIPVTQDFGPLTEDMIDKQVFSMQNFDDEVHNINRSQFDILLSDMQAFKAANPGSELEDFVRWHSPRDFIVEENGSKGKLSNRMNTKRNPWIDTWIEAKPIPISQQLRLFNETKEAETILSSFEQIVFKDLINYMLPILVVDSIRSLIANSGECLPIIKNRLQTLCKKVYETSRNFVLDNYYEIRDEIKIIEIIISRYLSIKSLLKSQKCDSTKTLKEKDLNLFLSELLNVDDNLTDLSKQLETRCVKIFDAPQGALASAIYKCFEKTIEDSRNRISLPARKQYIIRWIAPRPTIDSRLVPQRMYACIDNGVLDNDEPVFRLGGSFTSDITFS